MIDLTMRFQYLKSSIVRKQRERMNLEHLLCSSGVPRSYIASLSFALSISDYVSGTPNPNPT